MAVMADLLGYRCDRLTLDDCDDWVADLWARFTRYRDRALQRT